MAAPRWREAGWTFSIEGTAVTTGLIVGGLQFSRSTVAAIQHSATLFAIFLFVTGIITSLSWGSLLRSIVVLIYSIILSANDPTLRVSDNGDLLYAITLVGPLVAGFFITARRGSPITACGSWFMLAVTVASLTQNRRYGTEVGLVITIMY